MKCPKCGYVTHDYLDACGKCHNDWADFKREMHLQVVQPGDLDLSAMVGAGMGSFGGASDFSVDDSFFNTQTLIVDRGKVPVETDDEEFDIAIDDDAPRQLAAEMPAATLPADAKLAGDDLMAEDLEDASTLIQLSGDATDEDVIDLGLNDEQETGTHTSFFDTVSLEHAAHPPVDMIDMSDLEELGDDDLKSFEDVAIDLDAPDSTSASPAETMLAALPEESPDTAMPVFDLSDFDKTLELSLPEFQEQPATPPPPARDPGPSADELPDAEVVFELEDMDRASAPPPPTPQPTLEIDTDLALELEDVELAPNPTPAQPPPKVELDVEALELGEDDENT